ncbi:suppressor of fused domain protein [Streptomyces sp. MI02-7b]|uniref:suppressor of fused domain protein n=1 Tax=Streptomyces sp. MI02-7b TaxID=462941 RepID=UPI0029BBD741|nr:suppressor of fused domain protein [Streptomyces sp. MI02-7b]MDX3074718.1 suppressor of fused domain protein [Streptomyces sp. MI02-7b]
MAMQLFGADDDFADRMVALADPRWSRRAIEDAFVANGWEVPEDVSGDGDLVTAVTNGLRSQNLTAIMPLELACTLKSDQRSAARALAALTATLAIRMGVAPTFDQVIPAPEPLIPDTEIEGVIIVPHPYIEDGFEPLVNAEGRTELQLLTVVPVTAAEIAYLEELGADALYEQWEEQETDLLDVTRVSAV